MEIRLREWIEGGGGGGRGGLEERQLEMKLKEEEEEETNMKGKTYMEDELFEYPCK